MTRRPRLLTTATAVLLLAGCGGGGDDAITGADTGDSRSASPSASAMKSAERPTIELPSDVTDVYENWKTGDKTKDGILADTAARIDAMNGAILRGDTRAPALSFYYRHKALAGAVSWIQAYRDANLSFTGSTRYYAPKVTLSGKSTASVIYCSDESKGFNKNRKTDEVDRTPSKESSHVVYNTRVQKNNKGVWQATDLISKRGAEECAT